MSNPKSPDQVVTVYEQGPFSVSKIVYRKKHLRFGVRKTLENGYYVKIPPTHKTVEAAMIKIDSLTKVGA